MKVKISDVPPEGLDIEFPLSVSSLNDRVNAGHKAGAPAASSYPVYLFVEAPNVVLHIDLQGSSVTLNGRTSGSFRAACSRCAEDIDKTLVTNISIILQPRSPSAKRSADEVEDLGFGFYDGKEIDCSDIVEEQLILALPYTVACEAPSAEACPLAQASLEYLRREDKNTEGDERLALLRTLKVNGSGTLN
jgi:uncharacterized metal-binding protein YceD (DUF177 family)